MTESFLKSEEPVSLKRTLAWSMDKVMVQARTSLVTWVQESTLIKSYSSTMLKVTSVFNTKTKMKLAHRQRVKLKYTKTKGIHMLSYLTSTLNQQFLSTPSETNRTSNLTISKCIARNSAKMTKRTKYRLHRVYQHNKKHYKMCKTWKNIKLT